MSTITTNNYDNKSKNIGVLILCILIPLIIGALSGYITSSEIDSWYNTLQKPSFNPPNYLFGPVWTCLYILMGVSLFFIWKSPKTPLRTRALMVFGVQLFLNFWWSILFFSFHLLFISVIEILALLASIVYMIVLFRTIKPIAAYMNIPYLLWVSFATALTISIWVLN